MVDWEPLFAVQVHEPTRRAGHKQVRGHARDRLDQPAGVDPGEEFVVKVQPQFLIVRAAQPGASASANRETIHLSCNSARLSGWD
jgi:hypothetical protein